MSKTRLVDATRILARLRDTHKTIRFNARNRRNVGTAAWEDRHIFVVELEYWTEDNSSKVEVRGEGNDFNDALVAAWTKLETVCLMGLGPQALSPPIQQKVLANGDTVSAEPPNSPGA